MAEGYSTKRVVIAAITLALLISSVPFLAERLNAKVARGIPNPRPQPSSNETETFYGFVESLPSYQALEASLERLGNDSAKVLKAAAAGNDESQSLVVADYRASLRRVGGNLATLADRIGRERAELALEQLLAMETESNWTFDELVLCSKSQEED